MKKIISLLIMISLLLGCSSDNSELTEIKQSDLCVTHIGLKKNVCYGDQKVDVEKITGLTIDTETKIYTNYKDGLSVFYRDDKVVGVKLRSDSLNVYKIKYGKIGESKESIIKSLGATNALNNAPINLDYFYDSRNNSFMTEVMDQRGSHEEMEQVYILSFLFDSNINANSIMFTDMKMAIYLY